MRLGDLKKRLTNKTTTKVVEGASATPADSGDGTDYILEVFIEEKRVRQRVVKADNQADADHMAMKLLEESKGDWAHALKRERIR